ncbi:hypothetical protein J712_1868 [Acinetobacter baumannii 722310]|nr:hypothetical protein J712_1868 [Acinetobacter baumannii 722310]
MLIKKYNFEKINFDTKQKAYSQNRIGFLLYFRIKQYY